MRTQLRSLGGALRWPTLVACEPGRQKARRAASTAHGDDPTRSAERTTQAEQLAWQAHREAMMCGGSLRLGDLAMDDTMGINDMLVQMSRRGLLRGS